MQSARLARRVGQLVAARDQAGRSKPGGIERLVVGGTLARIEPSLELVLFPASGGYRSERSAGWRIGSSVVAPPLGGKP